MSKAAETLTLFIKPSALNLPLKKKKNMHTHKVTILLFFSGFLGPDCLPAGREERPGELEERPRAEDQDAGIRTQAGEVNADSAHPQLTKIPQPVRYNNRVVDAAINNHIKKLHFSAVVSSTLH